MIVQANDFTESTIRTVIGAVVTTNTRLAMAPGNVLLRRRETGLRSDSVANVSQLVTVSKELLTEKTGHLSPATLQRLDEGLRLVLSL